MNAVETIWAQICWLVVELFIKEAQTTKTVSWHQDITYWGMGETDDEVTAWVALSDVSVQAGCMRFIPGSHRNPIVSHHDTYDDNNLLSRGQEIAGINENDAVYGALCPGEMSLHHGRCFHASGPNMSDDRRIGLAIRYVTPEVRHEALETITPCWFAGVMQCAVGSTLQDHVACLMQATLNSMTRCWQINPQRLPRVHQLM